MSLQRNAYTALKAAMELPHLAKDETQVVIIREQGETLKYFMAKELFKPMPMPDGASGEGPEQGGERAALANTVSGPNVL